MKKFKVVLDFIKFVVAGKIAFYRNVINQLTGNVIYENPDVTLVEAKRVVDVLEVTSLAAKDGSRTAISAMHDAEQVADNVFRNLAAYVDRVAANDETKILSSGFHLSKQPVAAQKSPLAVENGPNSGSVRLVAKAVDKAGAYIWQSCKDAIPDNDSDWNTEGTSTRSFFDIAGLVVASKYYFRVAAVTPDGTTDFCAPVLKVVV